MPASMAGRERSSAVWTGTVARITRPQWTALDGSSVMSSSRLPAGVSRAAELASRIRCRDRWPGLSQLGELAAERRAGGPDVVAVDGSQPTRSRRDPAHDDPRPSRRRQRSPTSRTPHRRRHRRPTRRRLHPPCRVRNRARPHRAGRRHHQRRPTPSSAPSTSPDTPHYPTPSPPPFTPDLTPSNTPAPTPRHHDDGAAPRRPTGRLGSGAAAGQPAVRAGTGIRDGRGD